VVQSNRTYDLKNFVILQGHRYLEPPILGVQPFARQASTSRLPETCSRDLQFLVPSPAPPRKISTTHPKMSPHQIFHHQCASPGIDPIDKTPSVNPVHRTHAKDAHPKPANDHTLTSSRTRLSSPLVISREQRRTRSNRLPRRNTTATCVHTMGQDYPFTGLARGVTRTSIPPPFH
jgi:hypothetical protein